MLMVIYEYLTCETTQTGGETAAPQGALVSVVSLLELCDSFSVSPQASDTASLGLGFHIHEALVQEQRFPKSYAPAHLPGDF